MKRLLIPFLALALCSPAQATAYWFNIKAWNQPNWWECDDTPGFIRLPHRTKDSMNESFCVRPSTLIKTYGGGRVQYQTRSVWTDVSGISPWLKEILGSTSSVGDKSGTYGWLEVDCQMMESREMQITLVRTTSQQMGPMWSKISWQQNASIAGGNDWTEMRPLLSLGPVEKWICQQ